MRVILVTYINIQKRHSIKITAAGKVSFSLVLSKQFHSYGRWVSGWNGTRRSIGFKKPWWWLYLQTMSSNKCRLREVAPGDLPAEKNLTHSFPVMIFPQCHPQISPSLGFAAKFHVTNGLKKAWQFKWDIWHEFHARGDFRWPGWRAKF